MARREETPIELDLSEDTLSFIVIKAREFDVKVEPVVPDPGGNGTDDDDREVLDDLPDDSTEAELRDAILGLDDDAKVDLVALFWLGRGDYERSEWRQARQDAAERVGPRIDDYLLGTPMLADYLAEGYAALGYSLEGSAAEGHL